MNGQKVYLVSKTYCETSVIFGVFAEDELNDALSFLAKAHISDAEEKKKEDKKWYENTHLSYFVGKCVYGCEHMPQSMSLSLIDVSKQMFKINELMVGNVIVDGENL